MNTSITIRPADHKEATPLSELALRSKGHWGYSREFLDACRDELAVDPARVAEGSLDVCVATRNGDLLGYYAVARIEQNWFELDALFVDPPHIGNGVGRALLEHAIASLAARGAQRLTIQGDPNASRFYEAAGAALIGSRASGSIAGRELPLYEIAIGGA